MRGFKSESVFQISDPVSNTDFATAVLQAKRQKLSQYEPMKTNWVPATSNIFERLFSSAKQTANQRRPRLSPMHLEARLFLKVNKNLWNAELIDKIIAVK